jgi:hypothetical protein
MAQDAMVNSQSIKHPANMILITCTDAQLHKPVLYCTDRGCASVNSGTSAGIGIKTVCASPPFIAPV